MRRTIVALAIIGFVALWFLVSLHAGKDANRANSPAPRATSPTMIDPDDDDVASELTYHWQNMRYWRDEQRQIVAIVVLLCACGCAGAMRRSNRLAKYRRAEAGASR
jgi:hypothetical protein